VSDEPNLPAGDFSQWMQEITSAIRGERDSEVACDGCTACCTSSQFVHIEPDETDTLAHIPSALLFPAPRLPRGHRLLGYDERGHCPMLVEGKCSIYEHRPRTCRTYDCRVFPASGVDLDDPAKESIAQRARRWRFDVATDDDRTQQIAVRAAAAFLAAHPEVMPDGAPLTATQRAVAAVEIHDAFLAVDDESGTRTVIEPDSHVVRVELTRCRVPADAGADGGRIRSRP
jgi:Fe-S-cluster containining protein